MHTEIEICPCSI